MASPYQQEEGDDDMAAERELADDAMWKVIQKNTFTRWTNENLKGTKLAVTDLEKDLSDGLKLIALIEVLSGKKFQKYNKRPNFRTQKFENVTLSLKFLEQEEGIKLVNIDSSDIVDQKAKLIMGLIWTLILHYSISMPMWEGEDASVSKDQTPKQRLLAWIQSKIPEKRITNFTSDWNDGTAIAALVDALAPGLCPDWPNLNPLDKVKNAKEAMDLAEKWLDIPQLIKPDEMCNPSVDELSMMTYLSRFPNAHLKTGAPVQDKTNPARVRAYGPGLEPTGNVVGAPARFIVETIGAGKGDLEATVLNPKGAQEKCRLVFNNDRSLSYSCVYTPSVEGQYKVVIKFAAKEIPKSPYLVSVTGKAGDPLKVFAQGPGIEKTGVIVKRKTYLEVITRGAGAGMVDVGIVDPQGRKDTVKPTVTRKSDDVWYVEYTAITAGLHSVNIFFAGKPIPKSPFPVGVSPEGGPLIDASKLPKPVACTPDEAAAASLATPIKAAPGSTAPSAPEPVGKPGEPAKKQQPAPVPGKPLPIDAKKCWATGRGIQPKGVRVGDEAVFQVHTEGAGESEPRVMIMGPGGVPEKSTVKKIGTTFEYVYKPSKNGLYIINITFGGQQIPKSPFKVDVAVAKTSRVRAHGPGLETGTVGVPALFTVEPNGEGPIGFRIDGPSQAKIDVKKEPNGNMQVSYLPTAEGEYAVHVLSNNDDIPKSPFMANITTTVTTAGIDASKVTASGPGLERQGVVVSKWAEFTVDARQAGGPAPLHITAVDVDSKSIDVTIADNKNGTYSCRYLPTRSVKYTITITYGGIGIANSPYEVFVQDLANASKVKVYGPAVEAPVKAKFSTYLIIDCKEAGPGEPVVTLTNERGLQVHYQKIDNKDRTYRIEFVAQSVGTYTATVNFANQPVPKSPFKIPVEAGVDVSKVKVYGPAVEQPVFTSQLTYLIVDCKEAGPGVPQVTVTNDKGVQVPVKVTDNKDGTYKVEFTVTTVGVYTAAVLFAGQPVPKSPFRINAQSSVTVSRVQVKGLPETIPVNKEVAFDVVTAGAGQGHVKVNITSPTGKIVPAKVEEKPDLAVGKFTATEPGQHTVQVTFADQPVPNSPFKVFAEAPNPFKVRVYGPAVEKPVIANTPTYLIVDFKEAGPGEPLITLVDEKGVPVKVTTLDNKDKTFRVEFVATTVGFYTASVFFANQPVPNSPFKITVEPSTDANKVRVYGPAVEKHVSVHQSTYFIVDCKEAGPGEPHVTLTSETGVPITPTITDNKDRTYRVEFTTNVVGSLTANVSFASHPVPHSPFKIQVEPGVDASKVKVYGPAVEKPVIANQTSYLVVDCTEAGPGEPHVTLTSETGVPITPTITDNKDRTYRVEFTTNAVGSLTANVSFASHPVPHSPFKIQVEPGVDASKVKVYGPAVEKPVIANQTSYLVVDCTEAGPGEPVVSLKTEGGVPVPVRVTDNKDKTHRVEFNTSAVGTLSAAVSFANQPVPKSPFRVSVQPPVDLSKVHVKELPATIPVGKEVPFNIVTDGAGQGTPKVNLVSPTGKVTSSPVEPVPGGFVSKVTATEPGPHSVEVTFADQPIPHSPFPVNAVAEVVPVPSTVVDASKVKAYGRGLTQGTANTPCDFTIDTRAAGPGSLGLTIDGPTEAKIECFDKGGGLFDVRYWPTEPGEYTTNILFDEKPIPHSPFKAQVNPAKMVDVSGVKTYGPGLEPTGVFLDSVSEFTVDATSISPKSEGNVKVLITNPSGTLTEGLVTNRNDGTYQVLYTPFEQGPNKIDVSYDGIRVPKSPFTVDARPGFDPAKVKVYGPGIQGGQPNQPQKFTINTRGAGQGGVGLSVVGPTEPQVSCVDNQDGTLTVEYLPDTPGDYEIGVTFADHPVPGSPFHVAVAESTPFYPEKVKCFGPGLNPKGVHKGTKAVFSVITAQAGVANLEVVTTDLKTGERKPATIIQRPSGTYDVEYTPEGDGPYRLDVTYGGKPVLNSPFTTEIQPSQDVTKVAITGDGVKPHGVPASVPVAFTIDTRQSGDAPLDVEVKTPQGDRIKPSVEPVGDGTYKVSYNPEDVGEYVVDVKYAGQEVPNAPFHVTTVPTGHAEKVKVPENIRPQLAVGETNTITVRKSEAGVGNITFQMKKVTTTTTTTTTRTAVKEVDYTVVDNGDGTVTIKYTPLTEGTYTADIKFGGVTVPHGHFTQQVGRVTEEQVKSVETHQLRSEVVSSEYRPLDFPSITVGPDVSQVSAIITTPSGQKQVPRIIDNKDGTIKIGYQPTEVGQHVLQTFYSGSSIASGTYNFYIHSTKPGHVSAFGPGLIGGISGTPTSFTVVTKDAGPGGLGLAIEGPSKAEIQCKDNRDGTATITYTPVVPGDYKIIIKFAGQMIAGAPYTARITPAPGQEPSKQSHMTLGTKRQMSLTVTETDLTNLSATIRTPSGIEEPVGLKKQPNGQLGISFTPREVGDHWVSVFRNGQPIPGSPFKIAISGAEVGNASKVKVFGRGITNGVANIVNEFTIDTKEAGVAALSLSVQGPSKADIKCHDNPDGTTHVTYKPSEPGNYQLTVKYGDEHVPGSPFNINVGGQPSGRVTERIVRQQQAGTIKTAGSTCELNITLAGISVQDIGGTVTSPSGVTEKCEVVDLGSNRFTIKFFPRESGVHTVSLKDKGLHIPGSPFQFTVGPIAGGGPEKVRAVGSGLERGEVNKPSPFTIITREAGAGGLSLGIEGPSKAVIDFQDRRDGTSDVSYVVTEPGEYLVSVKFNDQHIPDSPFKVYILPSGGDSKKLHVQNLQQRGLQVNTATQFTVDFNGAQGQLKAKVIAPSGAETEATVHEVQKDRYAVNFVPRESGVHYVHVTLNGNHVPGSPYPVQVGRLDADASQVRAYGDGLHKGQTGHVCKFIVNTSNAGSGSLSIGISGPSKIELLSREVEEGYEFSYTPLAPGDYFITIKYAGNTHIPGSPFKAHIEGPGKPAEWAEQSRVVVETVTKTTRVTQQYAGAPSAAEPDASKVTAMGNGLQQAIVNQEAVFMVDGSKAGYNMLVVGIGGPQIPCEKIFIIHLGGLHYSVRYQLSQPGNYVIMVKWGDQHIPGSPFKIVAK